MTLCVADMYKNYHIFIMLLKFDGFFFLGFSVQYIFLVIANKENDWVSAAAIHGTVSLSSAILLTGLSYWSIRHENKIGMQVFAAGSLAVVGYLTYKLVTVWTPSDYLLCNQQMDECTDRFSSSRIILTEFIVICIVLGMVTSCCP